MDSFEQRDGVDLARPKPQQPDLGKVIDALGTNDASALIEALIQQGTLSPEARDMP